MGETVPIRPGHLLIRSLRLEVVAGPDAGAKALSSADSLRVGTAPDNDLVLTDRTVSRYHFDLRRAGDRVLVVDLATTNGTEIGPVLLQDGGAAIRPGTIVRAGQTDLRVDDGDVLSLEVHHDESLGGLRGRTPVMLRLMAVVRNVAQADASVLLVGEPGTGKEQIARALHETGPRARRPFVALGCGAMPKAVLARELQGLGRARGGTLFLDDVGELPPDLQAMLLGILEGRDPRHAPDEPETPIDVRVVAATPRDLRADVNDGRFRLDLYHRIAVVMLRVPPLRDRADDVPLLVEHFLREAGSPRTAAEVFAPDALETMRTYPWPGNVRELRNVVAATLALGQAPPLEGAAPVAEAPAATRDPIGEVLGLDYREARGKLLSEFETRYLGDLLQRTGGNVRQAAREARMDRSYLIELLRRHQR
jgi:DNA-binding NtrC family response regulator